MADTEITWRGLTLGGDSPYIVQSITGWDDLPDTTDLSQPRTRGDGDHVGDLFSQARIVTVTGKVADVDGRDDLARALRRVTQIRSDLYDLTIETLGQALTSQARVLRRSLAIGDTYAVGEVPFSVQFRCPDPLRYGPELSVSTGLPASGGGLAWPLFQSGVLDWGPPGTSGQVTLTNDGDADAGIVFDVAGGLTGLPGGFEISAAGQRITYPTAVPAGQTVTIDTAAGTVLVEGTADRRGELTNADWMLVPAGGSLTVQFTSLGAITLPTAVTRTNFALNPGARADLSSWSTYGGGSSFGTTVVGSRVAAAWSSTGWAYRIAGSASSTSAQLQLIQTATSQAGAPVAASLKVVSSAARNLRLAVRAYSGATSLGDLGNAPAVAVPAGVPTVLTISGLVTPATTTSVQVRVEQSDSAAFGAGDTVDVSEALVERAAAVGAYFDGSTAGSGVPGQPGAITYSWTGTANASTSIATTVLDGGQLLTGRWKAASE